MGVSFPGKKRYGCVRFNVISVTRGWVGVKFPGKKRYVTLEWPPIDSNIEARSAQNRVNWRRLIRHIYPT